MGRHTRRKRPNDLDLARLKEANDIIIDLMTRLNPATPEYRSLERAHDGLRTCAIDWTGNPDIWKQGFGGGWDQLDTRGFIKRPDHDVWPR